MPADPMDPERALEDALDAASEYANAEAGDQAAYEHGRRTNEASAARRKCRAAINRLARAVWEARRAADLSVVGDVEWAERAVMNVTEPSWLPKETE